MSNDIQLTYPRLRLIKNCVFTTPAGKAEFSFSTKYVGVGRGWSTMIYALSSPAYATTDLEYDEVDAKGSSGFDEYAAPLVGRPHLKRVVAEVHYRPSFIYDKLTVEVPNRKRTGSAVVGPMRRGYRDMFIQNAHRETVMLSICGNFCECFWVRKDHWVTELRLVSNNAVIASFKEDELGVLNGKSLSPKAHIQIKTKEITEYLMHRYYDRTPKIFTAMTIQQDIVDEVLIAYFSHKLVRGRMYVPEVASRASRFGKWLYGSKSNAAFEGELESGSSKHATGEKTSSRSRSGSVASGRLPSLPY